MATDPIALSEADVPRFELIKIFASPVGPRNTALPATGGFAGGVSASVPVVKTRVKPSALKFAGDLDPAELWATLPQYDPAASEGPVRLHGAVFPVPSGAMPTAAQIFAMTCPKGVLDVTGAVAGFTADAPAKISIPDTTESPKVAVALIAEYATASAPPPDPATAAGPGA
jgi:hypothetical protein